MKLFTICKVSLWTAGNSRTENNRHLTVKQNPDLNLCRFYSRLLCIPGTNSAREKITSLYPFHFPLYSISLHRRVIYDKIESGQKFYLLINMHIHFCCCHFRVFSESLNQKELRVLSVTPVSQTNHSVLEQLLVPSPCFYYQIPSRNNCLSASRWMFTHHTQRIGGR